MSRREFTRCCGAALALMGGLAGAGCSKDAARNNPEPGHTPEANVRKGPVRVALTFVSKPGAPWPSPQIDVLAREKEIAGLLKKECPGIEFTEVAIRQPEDVGKAIALKNEVDGYLVYVVTTAWELGGAILAIGNLRKPMVVADENLGGSGVFLRRYSQLQRVGFPAAGVSSSRLEDLVAVARHFADLRKPGATPATFADQCWATYRGSFPKPGSPKLLDDPVELADIGACAEQLKKHRFLIVGKGKPGSSIDLLGAEGMCIGFDEFKTEHDKINPKQAAKWAEKWQQEADKLRDATPEWIDKAARVYLANLRLLEKYKTDTITMDCLKGFESKQLPAYPCLGFRQLLNDGAQGICEAMPDDAISMLMARMLTGRPGYVSDPVLDTSKNQIIYAHCMGTTKPFGPDGAANPFHIRWLHNNDPHSAVVQSVMPTNYMTTTFRTNLARKQMVIHQAAAVANLDGDNGCRTQMVGEPKGDMEKLFSQWDHFGWHRVTVYGDVKEPLEELAKVMGLSIIQEA